MADKPINLRQARKTRARQEARQKADENAARHGEAKPLTRLRDALREKHDRDLDGHKRDD